MFASCSPGPLPLPCLDPPGPSWENWHRDPLWHPPTELKKRQGFLGLSLDPFPLDPLPLPLPLSFPDPFRPSYLARSSAFATLFLSCCPDFLSRDTRFLASSITARS